MESGWSDSREGIAGVSSALIGRMSVSLSGDITYVAYLGHLNVIGHLILLIKCFDIRWRGMLVQ